MELLVWEPISVFHLDLGYVNIYWVNYNLFDYKNYYSNFKTPKLSHFSTLFRLFYFIYSYLNLKT